MLDFVEEFFLSIAAATPLPTDDGNISSKGTATPSRPITRSQAAVVTPATTVPLPQPNPRSVPKSKQDKRKFNIFIDPLAANEPPRLSSKKSKASSRVPLAVRTDSANSTPAPSPRTPTTPFPFSSADPCWENTENYDPRPYMTPPSTPAELSPTASPFVGPPPRLSTRTLRPRRAASPRTIALPRSMEIYNMLGLEDWSASAEDIRAAYRRAAIDRHPDRVVEEERDYATLRMQQLNAARDLLLNPQRRRQYHVDGLLPWIV